MTTQEENQMLKEATQQAEELVRRLREARVVDPEDLREPMTL
jgi:3-oxoacyl-[acyl-carrier-protein] synthase III